MNVNVYLPDELGQRAKAAELPLSRLLRDAVVAELGRRDAVAKTLEGAEEYMLDLEDSEGHFYHGRLNATLIAYDEHTSASVFLTPDETVVLHVPEKRTYWELDDPEENLREELDEEQYVRAMRALGITPVVDLDV